MKLRLSAPKEITWWIAVVIGAAGILTHYKILSFGIDAFLFVMVGFFILMIATLYKGL